MERGKRKRVRTGSHNDQKKPQPQGLTPYNTDGRGGRLERGLREGGREVKKGEEGKEGEREGEITSSPSLRSITLSNILKI